MGISTPSRRKSLPFVSLTMTQILRSLAYHVHTLLLFTWSDLQTVLIPDSAFGILTSLACSNTAAAREDIIRRIPHALMWVWMNQLTFNVSNQRRPESVAEDKLNKPWRPMPSGRLSSSQAKYILALSWIGSLAISWMMGGMRPSIILIVLGILYNDLGFGDMNGVIRNFTNASGFITFDAGALEIARGRPLMFETETFDLSRRNSPTLEVWLLMLLLVVFTTGHTQDMHDQEGDKARKRKSLPLQIGDGAARWVTTVFMVSWGVLCPYYWQCSWVGYTMNTPLAFLIAYRSLSLREVNEDRMTFRLWNVWMFSLYGLPLSSTVS